MSSESRPTALEQTIVRLTAAESHIVDLQQRLQETDERHTLELAEQQKVLEQQGARLFELAERMNESERLYQTRLHM